MNASNDAMEETERVKNEIPDKILFTMCERLNRDALTELPPAYTVRSCRRGELSLWKAMPFDEQQAAGGV